jgi:hypothetical protein
MTAKIIHHDRLRVEPRIEIGPRVAADIRRRIREIESRWPAARTSSDWHELNRLRQLLRLVETRGGGNG